eukprot:m.224368 g.224368  ORF g.224368 m.224368 type:complete len:695 (+) comp33427_c0_seq2:65-2149(+)
MEQSVEEQSRIQRLKRKIMQQATLFEFHTLVAKTNESVALLNPQSKSSLSHTRFLTKNEIGILVRNGNRSSVQNWSNVRLFSRTDRSWDAERVRGSVFAGHVVLGFFGEKISSGVYNSTLRNVVVLDEAMVWSCANVSSCVINRGATVQNCGLIECSQSTTFANGRKITIGPETGGREIEMIAQSDFDTTARCCLRTKEGISLAKQFTQTALAFVTKCESCVTIIGEGATVMSCVRVNQTYVGRNAVVESSSLDNTTIMGEDSSHPSAVAATVSNSIINNSIIQRTCTVTQGSVVESSLMCECSHVERHGMLISSVLGSFSSVGEGEVGSSLVGPFTGFHHQSLLVAAYWPAGRGNIAYGANIGSNNTGRKNDQEIWPGEGVFFGLGCSVKFPCNFSASPYSIIASSVTLLPQLIAMPFSLINTPSKTILGLSSAINEISPGWVLSDNAYTLLRNKLKYTRRQAKAQRTFGVAVKYSTDVLRASTINLMFTAVTQLEAVFGKHSHSDSASNPVYIDKDLRGGIGIGKNYLTESSRKSAISAYKFYIEFFALGQLWKSVFENGTTYAQIEEIRWRPPSGTFPAFSPCATFCESTTSTSDCSRDADVAFAFGLLFGERNLARDLSVQELLKRYVMLSEQQYQAIYVSKSKDYQRGKTIIPDYEAVHDTLDNDEVIIHARTQLHSRQKQLKHSFPHL